jgi:hypothetical protein
MHRADPIQAFSSYFDGVVDMGTGEGGAQLQVPELEFSFSKMTQASGIAWVKIDSATDEGLRSSKIFGLKMALGDSQQGGREKYVHSCGADAEECQRAYSFTILLNHCTRGVADARSIFSFAFVTIYSTHR